MSFNSLAPFYRGMETALAGRLMQRCRTAFLTEAQSCQRALLLGEGPGKFLVEVLRSNPQIHVTCVESSPRMVAEALRQVGRNGLKPGRVQFETCDARRWRPSSGQFDLVATHFFLDCFPRDQLEPLVTSIAGSTAVEARWLLTDFQIPAQGWQRWRAKAIVALMYGFFRVATRLPATRLATPDAFLHAAGFELVARRNANFGLIHSDLWRRTAV